MPGRQPAPRSQAMKQGWVSLALAWAFALPLVACASGEPPRGAQPGPTEPPVPVEAETVVRLAKGDVARREGGRPEEVVLRSIQGAEWRDASLGVPEPGRMYAQVITPGYRLELEFRGRRFVYHTSRTSVVRASPRP